MRAKIPNCFPCESDLALEAWVAFFYDGEGTLLERKENVFFRSTFLEILNSRVQVNQLETHRDSSDNHFQKCWQVSSILGKLCNEHSNIPRNVNVFLGTN